MANIQDPNFNKNVSMVYTEMPGFTGYRGFDFTKIDNIEDILREGVVVSGFDVSLTATNNILTGIRYNTSGIKSAADSINSKLFTEGDELPGTRVYQADLSPQFDGVQVYPEQSTGVSNFTPGSSNGTILNYNDYRRELYVQNLQSGNLYVKFGPSASANSFNFVLASATASGAGDGGSLSTQNYQGLVSVSGPNPSYIAWERV